MSTSTDTLARGLGLASLALGVPQVAAPDRFAQAVGAVPDAGTRELTVGIGLRELTAAAGLLVRGSSPTFLWSRVAGTSWTWSCSAAPCGAGGPGAGAPSPPRPPSPGARRSTSPPPGGPGPAASRRSGGSSSPPPSPSRRRPRRSTTSGAASSGCPSFMAHLESVEWTGEGRTRWTATAPLGTTVTWDAELTEDVHGERIAWRSLPGADVDNSGSVRFEPAPAGRGTEVRVHLRYALPGGRLGATVARLLGEDPHQQVEDDLRRAKQVLETGEVVRSDGSPEGSVARHHLLQSSAAPS
jgi:hypothetical protein